MSRFSVLRNVKCCTMSRPRPKRKEGFFLIFLWKHQTNHRILWLAYKTKIHITHIHMHSCYMDRGDKGPPCQGKELVNQEPESLEVLSLIQGNLLMKLRRLSFSQLSCPCLLFYDMYMSELLLNRHQRMLLDVDQFPM